MVHIHRPDGAEYAYFCGRHGKSGDSLNVQYITDKDGRVRHIITGLAGPNRRTHQWKWLGLIEKILMIYRDESVSVAELRTAEVYSLSSVCNSTVIGMLLI